MLSKYFRSFLHLQLVTAESQCIYMNKFMRFQKVPDSMIVMLADITVHDVCPNSSAAILIGGAGMSVIPFVSIQEVVLG